MHFHGSQQNMLAQMLRGLAQTLTKSFGNIIAKKDAEIRELKVRVTTLEEKTDELEQYSRRNTIRIRGYSGGPKRGHRWPRQRRRREKAGRPANEARFRSVASSRPKE